MEFLKYCPRLLLLYVVLISGVHSDSVSVGEKNDGDQTSSLDKLPVLTSIPDIDFKGPIAPIFVKSLLTISLASKIISSNGTLNSNKADFIELQAKLTDQLSAIPNQISDETSQLSDITTTYMFFKKLRNDLNFLRDAVSENLEKILNPKTNGITKKTTMHAMLDVNSSFRKTLKSFVDQYIQPKHKTGTEKNSLFYVFVLSNHLNANLEGDDCYFESVHTRIFKFYVYLLETLSNAYAMAISAHTIQYQKELRNNVESALQTTSRKLLNEYKNDMKTLMEKSKWALEEASRDVRRCGTFDYLQKGDTFDRVSFAHILPKIRAFNFWPKFQCMTYEKDVRYNGFEIGQCHDGGLTRPASLSVFLNRRNSKWPYVYLVNKPLIGKEQIFGNSSLSFIGLSKHSYYQIPTCFSEFCKAYKKKVVGVSTQLVSVAKGKVITGVRFAVRRDIIYIDVREGKLLDDLSVDPESLKWVSSSSSSEILYLDSNIRNFELGDIEVEGNDYLRTIQFELRNEADGIIGLCINGEPVEYTTKSNEVVLSESESAEKFGAGVKNLVSKAPIPSEPYHVSLQSSDLKKDFGISTIPYFDIREVITLPAAPLAGIGMYHQTVKGSGGYISLRLKQINLSRFIDYDLVEKTIDAPIKIQDMNLS